MLMNVSNENNYEVNLRVEFNKLKEFKNINELSYIGIK